jgi:hypothetical protein
MKTRLILMTTLATCLAVSCSRAPRLKLCNQTDADITITVEQWQTTITKGATAVFTFPFATKRLAISTSSKTWEYDFPYPPREYCQSGGSAVIHAQLEADGRIYVFLPKTSLPAADLSTQPDGFPLNARDENK